ncbi:MAG: hypothetical protein ACP5Q4_03785 [Candidatus Caldatribacteriaceae bacterium]
MIRGELALPSPYFKDFCGDVEENPGYPLSFARVTVRSENGEEIETFSDCFGKYEVRGVKGTQVVVYARREGVQVAGGISSLRSGEVNEVGVINAYTTAQVAIFEAAFRLYPQSVYFRDIPNFTPSETLVALSEEVLMRGENPLEDPVVQREAHRLIDVWFGG